MVDCINFPMQYTQPVVLQLQIGPSIWKLQYLPLGLKIDIADKAYVDKWTVRTDPKGCDQEHAALLEPRH